MINSFKNKGLEEFFLTGNSAKINKRYSKKLHFVLARLNTCFQATDMNFPGSDFHLLKGDRKGFYSVSINKNWRLIFSFHEGNAYDVEYLDYH